MLIPTRVALIMIFVDQLAEGMVMFEDVTHTDGAIIVSRGRKLTLPIIEKLVRWRSGDGAEVKIVAGSCLTSRRKGGNATANFLPLASLISTLENLSSRDGMQSVFAMEQESTEIVQVVATTDHQVVANTRGDDPPLQ